MLWIIHPGSSLPLPLDPVESNVIDVSNFASDGFFFVRPSVELHFSLMYYLLLHYPALMSHHLISEASRTILSHHPAVEVLCLLVHI